MKKNYKLFYFLLIGIFFSCMSIAQVVTQTLSYTGALQSFTSPACAQATITCYGGRGANGASTASAAVGGIGGFGAMAQGVISLTAGQVVNVFVGGAGTGSVGGFNGGGNGGTNTISAGAGGGASDIRIGGLTLADRIIVAGGGGGGGHAGCASATITGGNGGAGGGGNGTAGVNSQAGWGGQGGVGTTGGAAGIGCSFASGTVGVNGSLGQGGKGGNGPAICGAYVSGGGGGGGYNGGGGGGGGSAGTTSCTLNDQGAGGGGAGGTNYFASSITNTISSNGINNGNGYVVISYSVLPSPTISVNSGVITSGQSFTMTPSGASTYTFSNGSAVVSPTANTSYSIVGTSTSGCVSSNTAVSTVVVIPPCSIANQTVNAPSPSSLCGTGTSTITLQNSENGIFYFLRDNATNSIIDGPISGNGSNISFSTGTINTTTNYNVNALKDYGIALPSSNDIVRFSLPFYVYTNQITIESWVYSQGGEQPWAGQSSIAADNMATNVWLWHAGTFYVNNNGNWINLNFPTIPSGWTHVASVADASGMYIYYNGNLVASNSTGITSGIRNNSSSVIDLGHDPRFTVGTPGRNSNTGFDNFKVWNVARTGTEIAANINNCNISSANLVLKTDFLEGSGTSIVSYSGPQGQLINPTSNWVLGSRSCPNCELQMNQTVTVTVNPLPTIAVNSGAICAGQSFTMTPSGADSYTYSNGSAIATPTSNNSYTVTGTNTVTGCSNTAVSSVTVNSLPTVSVSNATVCMGQTVTLNASSTGSVVNWYASPTSTNVLASGINYSLSPTSSSTVYVQSTNSSVGTSTVGLSDNSGGGAQQTSSNYNTFDALTNFTLTSVEVYPGSTGNAVIDLRDNSGALLTSTTVAITSTVGPITIPVNFAISPGTGYQLGQGVGSVSLFRNSSGVSYPYTLPGVVSITNSAAGPSFYYFFYKWTVSTFNSSCSSNMASVEVTVNSLPTVSVNSGSICSGSSFTMTPSGASTYTYSSGTDVVSPTANDSYTVTGTDANGCVSAIGAVSSVTVNSLPTLSVVTTNTLLCTGETATLSVSGATTYTWSTLENTADVAVTPSVQTTYTVDGTDVNGCSNSTTITQDVSACTGIATLSNDASINVYPNPNNGLFVVELTSASKVTVTNALGQVVLAENLEAGKHTVNINNESTGVYFVKVMTNNKQQIIKVIKE